MRVKRIIAMYLALSLVFEVISPSLALALTNGPGQPEMQSFEPVGTSEMVDVFTGDFNYNIPLLNVPGPNGGYPINMAYHSGVGMEDEASWVGLGWNINAGVITRDMRGLPDDFDGDIVTKELSMQPNRTVSAGIGFPLKQIEVWGLKADMNMSLRMSWNNYQGLGFNGGLTMSSPKSSGASDINKNNGFSSLSSLNLEYNSLSGETTLRPNFSLAYAAQKAKAQFSLGAGLSNLQGLKDINFSSELSRKFKLHLPCKSLDVVYTKRYGDANYSSNTTFASGSFVPHSEFAQNGFMANAWFSFGADVAGFYANLNLNADYAQTGLATNRRDMKGYGYMHSEDRRIERDPPMEEGALMDFNREKDVALSKDVPSMPVPVFTHDVYMVKGQGVGGVFRPFRSDLGVLHDPIARGENLGATAGLEFGGGYPLHFGGNVSLSFSRNYSGPWRNYDTWSSVAENQFSKGGKLSPDSLTKDPLYEPFYFKSPSEMTANLSDENDRVSAGGKYPVSIMFSPPSTSDLLSADLDKLLAPFVEVRADNGMVSKNKYDNRRSRSEYMGYKTIAQIKAYPNYQSAWVGNTIYKPNVYPRSGVSQGYTYPSGIDHQIGEISVINPDGNRYIYALPAYNFMNKEASFSVERSSHATFYNDKIVDYKPADASTKNTQQQDHFFSSNKIPAYAHSHLLTAIVSPDYIDLTGNGPSDDDFGYYVKFNYTRTNTNYHWRAPYEGANFLRGHLSSDTDDKAGYAYGEKENWYLSSIETKTHIAEFKLSPRVDGYGAGSEHQKVNTATYTTDQQLYKLDEISLYSKNDPNYLPTGPSNPGSTGIPTPLKVVHFEYTYALCPNVRNNSGTTVNVNGVNVNQNKGKLTLKKVWFSYLKNYKGALSPYVFDYHEDNAPENPSYDILQMDRWGNYRKDNPAIGDDNTVNPYTIQRLDLDNNGVVNQADADIRNNRASAWSLKRIVLPSGGELKVDYEADDYGYVQNKQAMQMARVLGYADNVSSGVTPSSSLLDKNEYLLFELEDESAAVTDADVKRYGSGLSEVFFKAYIDLKTANGSMKSDYVEGYAETEPGVCGLVTANVGGVSKKCGYIKIKKVALRDNGAGQQTHPFRKAAWQYLRLERIELLFPGTSIASDGSSGVIRKAANILADMFKSGGQLFTGYYRFCWIAGYARDMNGSKPSFVRLFSPDRIKYGGGHRVKRITVSDLWTQTGSSGEMLSEYGQEYTYRLPDGSSSGVAAYEPLVGGEEIPHRKPIRYSSPYFIFKNKNLYLEEPLGESYFPAPIVGYSRVVVKNVAPPPGYSNTKTQDGTSVYEFYTARDFPVQITTSDPSHEKFTPKIPIPCIGSVFFDNHGYSQRISVETNDMHGKMRSLSTYAAGVNINNPDNLPVARTEYVYKTDAPYSPGKANHLNNSVQALFGDADLRTAEMGVTREFFTDMRESSGVTMKLGLQGNLEVALPFISVPMLMPIVDYSESLFKSVMAVDVIGRNGILTEVNTNTDGSLVSQKNLLFDASSGQALQTSVTNDFDKPIYTYNYAAHWVYDGMDNAFKNAGAVFDFDISGSYLNCSYGTRSAYDIFYPGDEIVVMNAYPANALPLGQPTTFWVKSILNPSAVELVDEQGNPPAASYAGKKKYLQGYIARSGHRNQQSVSNGSFVSLSDPMNREYPILTAWNNKADSIRKGLLPVPGFPLLLPYTDCANKTWYPSVSIITVGGVSKIHFDHSQLCQFDVNFPGGMPAPADWYTLHLHRNFNTIEATKPGTFITCSYTMTKCNMLECIDVLDANATVFSDDWTFDYPDVGNPLIKLGSVTQPLAAVSPTLNPYRTGNKGIWRAQKSYAYQIERQQTNLPGAEYNTDVAKDGSFKNFVFFKWSDPTNPQWTLANTMTRYSPYGFDLENKNALGIYSSALYGYDNALPTSVAQNASYYELAFDGFEELKSGYTAKGHLALSASAGPTLQVTRADAHTGDQCLSMAPGQSLSMTTSGSANYNFRPVIQPGTSSTKYTVSAWFKTQAGIKPQITVSGMIIGASTRMVSDGLRIEGWQKAETTFEANGGGVTINFVLPGSTGTSYIDDVRIQPFKSQMKAYVYNPQNLWLVAELDEQNYASYYNYDQEGTLVQVKKETTSGIQTLQTSRSNVKRN